MKLWAYFCVLFVICFELVYVYYRQPVHKPIENPYLPISYSLSGNSSLLPDTSNTSSNNWVVYDNNSLSYATTSQPVIVIPNDSSGEVVDEDIKTDKWRLIVLLANFSMSSTDFSSQKLCDEAASMALYNDSLENRQAIYDEIQHKNAAFIAAHPPHLAITVNERQMIADCKTHGVGDSWSDSTGHGQRLTKDCKIQDTFDNQENSNLQPYYPDQGQWLQIDPLTGAESIKGTNDARVAMCIQ